jgi:stage II sporulation protein E
MQEATAKFLKVGTNPSFIKRGDQVQTIETGNLPMGMVKDFDIDVTQQQLKAGDILIMMSDGVFEGPRHIQNKEIWMRRKIKELETEHPQDIADLLLEEVIRARGGEIDDDMTVLVSKIQHHTPKWSVISTYTNGEYIQQQAQ